MNWDHPDIRDAIRRALAEDVGAGDVTTDSCVPADARASGFFLTREPLKLAGTPLLPLIYDEPDEEVEILHGDGVELPAETVFARVRGRARRLLTLERSALNFLQRSCGIALNTSRFMTAMGETKTRLLDTRKTTPGLRIFEKLSVRAGGGVNHRIGLFDAVLIKNNHIAAAGGVREAFERCRASGLPIEIEVRTFDELDEALSAGAKRLLLDNFTPDEIRRAMARIDGRAEAEVSGGVTLETIGAYAAAGPDYISVGALTHSAPSADISFRIE